MLVFARTFALVRTFCSVRTSGRILSIIDKTNCMAIKLTNHAHDDHEIIEDVYAPQAVSRSRCPGLMIYEDEA